ncbi:hypothetical protein [Bacillus sp. CGMCC 1.16541]|uniref:hypothetical protein n=1 Tax=Bacillus sp. CGMCC 1.16541 TaxID=2185143 RepID=UPI000D7374A1|nr:hypothetical protein [Bacillus sp. CGMCC 1.16541]
MPFFDSTFHLWIGFPFLSVLSGIIYELLFRKIYLGMIVAFFLPFILIWGNIHFINKLPTLFLFGLFYATIAYVTSKLTRKKTNEYDAVRTHYKKQP